MTGLRRKNSQGLTLTVPLLLLILIIGFGAFLRLHWLHGKAYHHDESIHAYYAWKLWDRGPANTKGDPSHYDPVYHGPVIYTTGAAFFFLFGDTDFTGRLPFAAAGIFAIYLAWLLFKDREANWQTALLAAAAMCLSPSMTYFARFAREDVYFYTWNLGMVVFAVRYFKSLRASDFMLMCLFFLLTYATKENSFVTGAILCGFAVLYGAVRVVFDREEWLPKIADDYSEFVKLMLLYGLFTVFIFFFAAWYAFSGVYRTLDGPRPGWSEIFPGNMLMGQMTKGEAGIYAATRTWWLLFLVLMTAMLAGLGLARHLFPSGRAVPGERTYRHPIAALIAFGLFLVWGYVMCVIGGLSVGMSILAVVAVAATVVGLQFLFAVVLGGERVDTLDLYAATSILRRNVLLIWGLLMIFFLYAFYFTCLFVDVAGTGKNGIIDGVLKYLAYWFTIQHSPRLLGPDSYWLWRILVYEPVLAFLCIWAVFTVLAITVQNYLAWQTLPQFTAKPKEDDEEAVNVPDTMRLLPTFKNSDGAPILGDKWLPYVIGYGCALVWCLVLYYWALYPSWSMRIFSYLPILVFLGLFWQIARERPMYAFLIFYSYAAVEIYSHLDEKAPWLVCHQVLPMVLLAALFLSDFLKHVTHSVARHVMLIPVYIFLVYGLHANMLVNFQYADDPREMLVYTQTDPKFHNMVKETEALARELGTVYDTKISVSGESNWPMTWYLRRYKQVQWAPPSNKDFPIAFVDENARKRMERILGGDYYIRVSPIRSWWQPENTELRKMPWKERWSKIMAYMTHRTTWSNTGSQNIHVYRKYEPFERVVAPTRPEVPFAYDTPRQLRAFGSGGVGQGQFQEPRGLAVAGNQIYVADSRNGRVQVFTLEGTFVRFIPDAAETRSEAQLSKDYTGVSAVAVDSAGNVYVTDSWQRAKEAGSYGRIVKYDAQGRYVAAWERPTGFFAPRGIAVNSQGEVWVVDTGNKRIQVFDSTGRQLGAVGGDGVGPAEFVEPVGVAIGANDLVFVADTGNTRVQVLDRNRAFQYEIPLPTECWETSGGAAVSSVEPAIAVAADGNVYISDSAGHSVWVVSNFGRAPYQVKRLGRQGSGEGMLRSPKGVGVDAQGNVYISDTMNQRIVVYAPATP